MIRSVLSKKSLLKLSLIAALCTQSTLLTDSPTPKDLRYLMNPKNVAPKFHDESNSGDKVDSDWEQGWDVDWHSEQVDVLPLELTEFPTSSESFELDHPSFHQSNRDQSVIYPFNTKAKPGDLVPLDKALNANASGNFFDSDDDGWIDSYPVQNNPAEISSATKKLSTALSDKPYRPTLDEVAINLYGDDEEDAQDDDYHVESLGKKTVATDPYILSNTQPASTKSGSKQVISSKKTPYSDPAIAEQKRGIFGPQSQPAKITAQNEIAQPQSIKAAKVPKRIVEPRPDRIIAQAEGEPAAQKSEPPKTILIDYNNISIIEYIRFVSRITGKNFLFDENDLQFNVTIISEEPTTVENVLTALIQELRIHGLSLVEEGNSLIIHRNDDIQTLSRVNVDEASTVSQKESELVTQVFKFNTLDPEKAAGIIRPLLSKQALVEASEETRHLIVTDLVANIKQIALLFKSIDAPDSGLVIGQYVIKNSTVDNLISLAKQIMDPIAKGQSLTLVPHEGANSIFVVSSPFLVDRTISVLQHIDNSQGSTRIYDLEELKYKQIIQPGQGGASGGQMPGQNGKWELDKNGNWIFRPAGETSKEELPQGDWVLDQNNLWYFKHKGETLTRPAGPVGKNTLLQEILRPGEVPRGRWALEPSGSWVFQLAPEEYLQPARLIRQAQIEKELPVGHIERTRFYIHKLQYRRGRDIVDALQQIGASLMGETNANADLAFAVQNTQWLESSNSLVITGTEMSILKVRELIEDLDIPLRQVFIEMLILQTNITDSLQYGVDFGTRSGGGNTATSQAFLGAASTLVTALDTTGVGLIPSATALARTVGFNMGIIGQRITHNGTQYASLGALISALHQRDQNNILLNPKIITEDNKPAEIFVGVNIPFQTQSIVNNLGVLVTNNVEFRDVGTTLKITPLIGAGDIITLEIHQEVSTVVLLSILTGQANADQPSTRVNRTTTTVHVPDRHFVIISGMIDNERERIRNQLPCLGGIPVIGAAVSDATNRTTKTNLMIFIRPQIIDTEEQFRTLTRQQQNDWRKQNSMKKEWKHEVDEALRFLNLKEPCCNWCDGDLGPFD